MVRVWRKRIPEQKKKKKQFRAVCAHHPAASRLSLPGSNIYARVVRHSNMAKTESYRVRRRSFERLACTVKASVSTHRKCTATETVREKHFAVCCSYFGHMSRSMPASQSTMWHDCQARCCFPALLEHIPRFPPYWHHHRHLTSSPSSIPDQIEQPSTVDQVSSPTQTHQEADTQAPHIHGKL